MVQTTLSLKRKNRKKKKNKKIVLYFQMRDATKFRMIQFKPIFSPAERTKTKNGTVIGYWQNKRHDGL